MVAVEPVELGAGARSAKRPIDGPSTVMSRFPRPTQIGAAIRRAFRSGRWNGIVANAPGMISFRHGEPGATARRNPSSSPAKVIAAREPSGPVTGIVTRRPARSASARGRIQAPTPTASP